MKPPFLLIGLSLVFFLVFALQRQRSTFLRVEASAQVALAIAGTSGLSLPEVLSLHELKGGRLGRGELAALVASFVAARRELGSSELAALTVMGYGELTRRALRDASGDAVSAWHSLLGMREAIWAVRFKKMAERFRARGPH